MPKTNIRQTEEKNALSFYAKQEGAINARQLLEEIEPLLKEYFVGKFEFSRNVIKMKFYNGQKFGLTAVEFGE